MRDCQWRFPLFCALIFVIPTPSWPVIVHRELGLNDFLSHDVLYVECRRDRLRKGTERPMVVDPEVDSVTVSALLLAEDRLVAGKVYLPIV